VRAVLPVLLVKCPADCWLKLEDAEKCRCHDGYREALGGLGTVQGASAGLEAGEGLN
jgi:hypothetical protein